MRMGAYHTGTVLYDQEYGYGGHPFPTSGIFEIDPKDTEKLGEGFSFKESIYVGNTHLSPEGVQRLLISMTDEYKGTAYHLLNFNCNTFTTQFIELLCQGVLPKWVNLLARFVSSLPFIESILPPEMIRPGLQSAEANGMDEAEFDEAEFAEMLSASLGASASDAADGEQPRMRLIYALPASQASSGAQTTSSSLVSTPPSPSKNG